MPVERVPLRIFIGDDEGTLKLSRGLARRTVSLFNWRVRSLFPPSSPSPIYIEEGKRECLVVPATHFYLSSARKKERNGEVCMHQVCGYFFAQTQGSW